MLFRSAYASPSFHASALAHMPYIFSESAATVSPAPLVSVAVLLGYAAIPLVIAAQTVEARDLL